MSGISVGDLFLTLGLDVGQFNSQLDDASRDAEKAAENMGGQFKALQDTLKAVGLAMTGVGAAGLAVVESSLKINASMGQTALTLGISAEEMRDLVLSVTSVDSPIKEVSATFDVLTRAGVRNTEEMKNIAGAFDTLADATGGTADGVASELIPAFRALGVELPKNSADLDKFTWLTKNTTVDLGDFSQVVQRLAPEMSTAGISMDDVVIALAALNEKGISGRVATTELGNAIKTASEKGISLTDALGLTTGQVQNYKDKLAESTGITDKYAEAANKQFGVMDQLKQTWSEITLRMGSFLTPMEPILAGITALGPVMAFLGTSMGATTVKWVAHTVATIAQNAQILLLNINLAAHAVATGVVTAAQWLWNTAMSANPIGIVIVAIGALVAAIVLIAKNWDTVREKTIEVWNTITGWLRGVWDTIVGFFQANWSKILAILFPAVGLPILIAQNWGKIVGEITTIWNNVTGVITDWWGKITGWIVQNMNPWNWIKKGWDEVTSGISGVLDHIFGHSIIEDWTSGLGIYLSGVDLGGPAASMMGSFRDGINSALDTITGHTDAWLANYKSILAQATEAQEAANAQLLASQAAANAALMAAAGTAANNTDMGAAVGNMIKSGMTDDQIRANYAGLLPPEAINSIISAGHQYAAGSGAQPPTAAENAAANAKKQAEYDAWFATLTLAQQDAERQRLATESAMAGVDWGQQAAMAAAAGFAEGGTALLTKPTLLLGGEAGDEIVNFTPLRGLSGTSAQIGGQSGMTIINNFNNPQMMSNPDIDAIGEQIANQIRLRTGLKI